MSEQHSTPEWLKPALMDRAENAPGYVQPGWLNGGPPGAHVFWPSFGDMAKARLDGEFTAQQLREMADHMDAHTARS